jgi:TetR/AcrR family transcriptional regulator, acrAB operon repressor
VKDTEGNQFRHQAIELVEAHMRLRRVSPERTVRYP